MKTIVLFLCTSFFIVTLYSTVDSVALTTLTDNKTDIKNVYILVHGTWGLEAPWYQVQGDFFEQVTQSALTLQGKVITFSWTGNLNHESRLQAALNLTKLIISYPENIDIHIIAHSHGANVVNVASQLLGQEKIYAHKIKKFFALGVPVDSGRYMPDMSVIDHCYNFFSFNDHVQTVLGVYERFFPAHERIANIRVSINGQEPTHTGLHSAFVGYWLPLMHDHLAQESSGNFNNFDFSSPGIIYFYTHKMPRYDIDYEREKNFKDDRDCQAFCIEPHIKVTHAY